MKDKGMPDFFSTGENQLRQVVEVDFPSKYGHFRLILYENIAGAGNHQLAIVKGHFNEECPVLVRIHSECLTGDMLGSLKKSAGGATPYFDFVATETEKGVASVSLSTGKPVIYGVLTCDTLEQALDRAGTKAGNKGWGAALSAIEMIDLLDKI
jgi:6,7-dimethyl-8-ribityllumazine synthase